MNRLVADRLVEDSARVTGLDDFGDVPFRETHCAGPGREVELVSPVSLAIGAALRRYRSFVVLVLATVVVVWLPARDNGKDGAATGVASTRGAAMPVAGSAAGPEAFDAVPVGRASASAALPGRHADPEAAAARPVAPDAKGYPAFGTPGALASPRCDRERQKVRFPSLYNPPCALPWPKGADNGGATAQGVTADKIKVVVYYMPRDANDQRAVSNERWMHIIRNQFNLFGVAYEYYGRKFDVHFFEASGEDEVAQRADAIQIATDIKPFAAILPDFTIVRRVWAAELAARGVIVWTPSITVAEANQRPGYRWGPGPDDRLHALLVGEYVAKRIYGRPAQWAGDPAMRLEPRRFGLAFDDEWDRTTFEATLQRFRPGAVLTDAVSHDPQASLTALQEIGRVQMARFKSKGVTNVIAVTGIFPTLFFTQAATAQNYFPEWTVTGWGQSDNAVTGKLYDANQWRNAAGVGMVPVFLSPSTDAEYVYQYRWVYGETFTSGEQGFVSQSNTLIFPIALGVHMAGPQLNTQTFSTGLFALPPVGGRWCGCISGAGAVGFGRHLASYTGDKYSMFEDIAEKWWDPNTVGEDEIGLTAPGVWRFVNGGRRYAPGGEFPSGEPPMFNPEGTVVKIYGYDNLPPNDRYPRYEKS